MGDIMEHYEQYPISQGRLLDYAKEHIEFLLQHGEDEDEETSV